MSSRDLRSGWCYPQTKLGPLTEESAAAILQHAITCYNDQSEWKRLRSMYKKRTSIVEEIIATEQNYVNQLRLVVEVFMQPLRVDPSYKNILSADDMKTIFSDIEVILSFNRVFLQQLVERHKSWDPFRTKLGDAFLTIADFLKVYTRYINNFNEAHWRLREVLSVSKDLQNFIQTQRKLTGNLDLDDFLIMPVQRIPRYNLLLADLVNNTWDHHPDSENLKKAKEKIHEIALFVNEQKRKVDNLKRVGDIILLISGLDEKYNLMSPTRRFVREGEVQEIAPDGERILYYVYLFNDLIIWTTQKKKVHCFKRMYYISKLNITISPIEGNKMAICLSAARDQVLMSPVKVDEMDDWLSDLIACRAESLEREEFSKVSKRKTFMHEELISSVQKKPKGLLVKIKDSIVPDESKILHTFKKAMTIADFYDAKDKKEVIAPIPDDIAPSGASISKSGPPPTYADDLKLLFSQPGITTPGRAKAATISGRGNVSSPSPVVLMSTSAPSLTLRPTMNGVITNPDKLKISQPRLVNSSYTPITKGASNPPTPPIGTPVVSPVNRSQFTNSSSSSPIVPRVNLVNIKPSAPARPLPPPPPNGESPANSPRNRALLSPRVDGSSEGPLTTPRSPRSPPPVVVSTRKNSDPGPKTESSLMLSGDLMKKSEAPPPPAQSLKPIRSLSKADSEVFVQKGPPPPVPLRPTVGPAAISPRGRANSKV